nr:unnamed protein product [Spirometra erinaceieuropaei]
MLTTTRLSMSTVYDLLFADDYAPNTATDADTERNMNLLAFDCVNFGLTSNTDKTAVMHSPQPNAAYGAPRTHVNSTTLKPTDNFVYLGSTCSRCTKVEDEEIHRISKVS